MVLLASLPCSVSLSGIPDTDYKSIIKMPAGEFQKICSNLSTWGESVVIATKKNGVKFSVSGDLGSGNITIKQSSSDDDEVLFSSLFYLICSLCVAIFPCLLFYCTSLESAFVFLLLSSHA
jgi:hypothetical protein